MFLMPCAVFVDKGLLHKSVLLDEDVHTVEEVQLLKNSEPIKTLLLSKRVVRTFLFFHVFICSLIVNVGVVKAVK